MTDQQDQIRDQAAQKRRQRRSEENRKDILGAAAEAFAEKGFQAATMQDIASRAGFTAAAIYTYFPGKDALFVALVQGVFEQMDAVYLAEVDANTTLTARLESLTSRLAGVFASDQPLMNYLISIPFGEAIPEIPGYPRQGKTDPFRIKLEAWFKRHSTDEERGGCSADEASTILGALMDGYMHRWSRMGNPGSCEDISAIAVRRFLGAIAT